MARDPSIFIFPRSRLSSLSLPQALLSEISAEGTVRAERRRAEFRKAIYPDTVLYCVRGIRRGRQNITNIIV